MTLGMTKKYAFNCVMETILQFIIISVVSIAGGYLRDIFLVYTENNGQ